MAEINNQHAVKRELKVGVILSYLLIAINIASGLLLVPFIVRNIGQSNYGIYTAASSFITMFIVDLGLGTAVTKFVSKYRVVSDQAEINKVISVVFTCFLSLSFLLLIIFACVFPFLRSMYSSFTDSEFESFKVVFIIVASYSILTFPFSIVNGMLVAYDKIFLSKLADIISKLVFIAITIFVLYKNLGLFYLTACYAVHGIMSIILKLIFVKSNTPCNFFTKVNKTEFKSIFKEVISFSIWAAINSFGRVILVSFAPTILGFTSPESKGSQEIAVFSFAVQIESYVSLFATSFGSIFYPSISRILFEKGKADDESLENFKRFHIKIARIQVSILALVIVGLVVCGKEFLHLWVGEGYENSYYCILAICIPALFFYPLQTAENAMAVMEKIKFCGIATIICTASGILFSIIFAYLWGAIGVSIGICVGFVVRTVLFNLFFAKYLNIKPLYFYSKSYLSFVLPIALSIFVGVALNMYLSNYSWQFFAVKVFVITVSYIVSLFIFGLNNEEKIMIDEYLKKIYRKSNNFLERIEK